MVQHPGYSIPLSYFQPNKEIDFYENDDLVLAVLCCGGEARGEDEIGLQLVAQVMVNRVFQQTYFGDNLRAVLMKHNRSGSIWHFEAMHPENNNQFWMREPDVVSLSKVCKSVLPILTHQKTVAPMDVCHYVAKDVTQPSWTKKLERWKVVGNHIFYQGI